MLTIGILFCDNDTKYLLSLLKKIKSRVTIDHEIIFFDNRDDFSSDISCIDGYKVLNTGYGNKYQVEGRRQIIQHAQGDYVWFIDCDDEPLTVDQKIQDLLNREYDCYCFGYDIDTFCNHEYDLYTHDQFHEGGLCNFQQYILVPALWNKIIKTDVLLKAEELIPDNTLASAGEDLMLLLLALKYTSTLFTSPIRIYKNNSLLGSSSHDDYSDNLDKLKRCTFGHAATMQLMDSKLSDADKEQCDFESIKRQDALFFIKKLLFTDNDSTRESMYEIYKQVFSPEYLALACQVANECDWMFEHEQKIRINEVRRELCGTH